TAPVLSGDPDGCSWVVALPEEQREVLERRVITTLIAANDDLVMHVLGTAFVIGASGNRALCMCAAHSLEQAKTFEDEKLRVSQWLPPPDLLSSAPRYLAPDRVKAVFVIDGVAIVCDVEQLNYIAGNDVALIAIVAPDGRDMFHEQVALDFS